MAAPCSVTFRAPLHPRRPCRIHRRMSLRRVLVPMLLTGVAMAIEQPGFEVVRRYDAFDLRRYGPVVVAQTEVAGGQEEAGSEGFRRLANYIFGGNRGRRKIEMTAPVAQAPVDIEMTAPVVQQSSTGDRWVVRFSMPAAWTLESLPEPVDDRVKVVELPGRTLAVRRYRGSWSVSTFREHEATLLEALSREGWHAIGPVEWARFDPPWMPWFLKHNEVWLPVERDAVP